MAQDLFLKHKLPRLNDAKIKEGICVGPQIRELIKDEQFEEQLNEVGKAAWQALRRAFWEITRQITVIKQ
jgi:hypothetical protein